MQGGSGEGGGSKFHALLGKALTDHEFRAALMDPEQQAYALESMGIEPTAEVLEALNSSIDALNGLASSPTMGPDIAAVA